MTPRFIVAFVLLLLALLLEIAFGDVLGVWLGFTLAILIAAAFFLDFRELLPLILFAALVLNWQPAWSPEILFFSTIPILVYVAKAFVPLQPFSGSLSFIFLSTLLFYLIFSPRLFIIHPGVFFLDLFASLIYGSTTFLVLKNARS